MQRESRIGSKVAEGEVVEVEEDGMMTGEVIAEISDLLCFFLPTLGIKLYKQRVGTWTIL